MRTRTITKKEGRIDVSAPATLIRRLRLAQRKKSKPKENHCCTVPYIKGECISTTDGDVVSTLADDRQGSHGRRYGWLGGMDERD